MAHWVGAQDQINLPKIQKHALIVTSPSENPKLKRRKKIDLQFKTCSICRGLNSFLAQSAGDLWLCKVLKICKKVAHAGLKGLKIMSTILKLSLAKCKRILTTLSSMAAVNALSFKDCHGRKVRTLINW